MNISEPVENATIRVISLGAGVQSTVMALMAAKGEISPMPDCAIFADTGYEPQGVYDHLDWLETQLPFPVHRVSNGNIKDDTLAATNSTGQRYVSIPFYTAEGGMGRRQCTAEYKLKPIRLKVREMLGLKKYQRAKTEVCEMWVGISWDEIQRLKDSRDPYIKNRWPLIEESMHRHHCMSWFEKNYPNRVLAKSACIACPFHNDALWRDMKVNDPVSFGDAVDFDRQIRSLPGFQKRQFLHHSCKPLDEVDFRNSEDRGQMSFLDECEGMCGI